MCNSDLLRGLRRYAQVEGVNPFAGILFGDGGGLEGYSDATQSSKWDQ